MKNRLRRRESWLRRPRKSSEIKLVCDCPACLGTRSLEAELLRPRSVAPHPESWSAVAMRLAVISAAVLVIATCIAVAQQGATSKENIGPTPQSSRQPATVGAAAAQAPTGHRQPRLSDLPPDTIRRQRT